MFDSKFAFKMQLLDNGIGELFIYDSITPDRKNYDGDVIASDTDANRIREKLDALGDISELKIYISSNGGDVKTGLAIYSMLKRKNCKKTAYIDGFAFSIASVIPMACDEIIMYPTSLMMIHNATACCFGNAEEHRKFADDLDTISASAVTAYLDKAGDKLDRETLNKLLNAETYLSADECLKYGLCDRIDSIQNVGNTPQAGMHSDLMLQMKKCMSDGKMEELKAFLEKLNSARGKDEAEGKDEKSEPKEEPKPDDNGKNAELTVTDKADMLVSAFVNGFFN